MSNLMHVIPFNVATTLQRAASRIRRSDGVMTRTELVELRTLLETALAQLPQPEPLMPVEE